MVNQGLTTGAPNTDSFQTAPMNRRGHRRGDTNFFSQRQGLSQGVRASEADLKRSRMQAEKGKQHLRGNAAQQKQMYKSQTIDTAMKKAGMTLPQPIMLNRNTEMSMV